MHVSTPSDYKFYVHSLQTMLYETPDTAFAYKFGSKYLYLCTYSAV